MSFPEDYQGWLRYQSDLRVDTHRLPVCVSVRIGHLRYATHCLVDTAADWCVFPPELARELGYIPDPEGFTRLSTRFGSFDGSLERTPVQFPAEEGEPLVVEATWFVSNDWPGPPVLGWKGCLGRFRFAFNPREERFYFGAW